MITNLVQRWRDQRGSYRPAGETISTSQYEVAEIHDDKTARAFVCQHHYAASYPSARFRVGLYRAAQLVGVAVFSHPMHDNVLAPLMVEKGAGVELGRLVLLEGVPGNGESWFLGRAFELLRAAGFAGVVSDADPMVTKDASGNLVCRGHVGTVYQATNGVYLGQTARRTRKMLPNGRVLVARAISKTRGHEKGWEGAVKILESFGAEPLRANDNAREWLATWVPQLTTTVRHPGNHRYLWRFDGKSGRRALPPSKPYPKLVFASTSGLDPATTQLAFAMEAP